MDLIAHAAYGATICSRSGLAGGRKGLPGKKWFQDSSVWWSTFFGILPDVLTMWPAFIYFWFTGVHDNYFHAFDGGWLALYRYIHSLTAVAVVSGAVFFLRRQLFLPSLAMGVHILCDAASHGAGKFQTLLLYPFSNFGIHGISFWMNLWFVGIYWGALVAMWVFLIVWRRKSIPLRLNIGIGTTGDK